MDKSNMVPGNYGNCPAFIPKKAIENRLGIKLAKVLCTSKVLYSGWELDPYMYLIEDISGKKFVITTNHGSWCLANKDFLTDNIDFYNEVILSTQNMLKLLES
jgi:hypothetical protein